MFQTTTVNYTVNDVNKLLNDATRFGIGMDDWIRRFATQTESYSTYPPYNYIKENLENFRLEFALAGYKKEDIQVYTETNKLFIECKKAETDKPDEYIHKGLAKRAFTWVRNLADDVEVSDVYFDNGMLTIKLSKIVPEHQKRKVYTVK
jgi:molecular chaperone IbpA